MMDQEFDGKGLTPYDPGHNSSFLLAGIQFFFFSYFLPLPQILKILYTIPPSSLKLNTFLTVSLFLSLIFLSSYFFFLFISFLLPLLSPYFLFSLYFFSSISFSFIQFSIFFSFFCFISFSIIQSFICLSNFVFFLSPLV